MARLNDKDRKQVGTIAHHCGQVAQVFQNRRMHLYLHCPLCGCVQNTTAPWQTEIYNGMAKGDVPFSPPRNLLKEAAPTENAPELRASTESATVDIPKTEPKPEPKTENDTEKNTVKSGSGFGLLLIFLGLVGGAVAVLR